MELSPEKGQNFVPLIFRVQSVWSEICSLCTTSAMDVAVRLTGVTLAERFSYLEQFTSFHFTPSDVFRPVLA